MERAEFEEKCQEVMNACGDHLHGIVGGMIGHFMVSIAKFEPTGLPIREKIPEGMAEAYIALNLIKMKYNITDEELNTAICERLTKK